MIDMTQNLPRAETIVTTPFYVAWTLLIGCYAIFNIVIYALWCRRQEVWGRLPTIAHVLFWNSVFLFSIALIAIVMREFFIEFLHGSVHKNACRQQVILSYDLIGAFDFSAFFKKFSFVDGARWRLDCGAVNAFIRLVQFSTSLFAVLSTFFFLRIQTKHVRRANGAET